MELSSFTLKLRGGTEQTVRFCLELKRPHELIDASKISAEDAAKLIGDFVDKNKINILNVAGPRQSEWPEGYDYASRALEFFSRRCSPALGGWTKTAHRTEYAAAAFLGSVRDVHFWGRK